MKSINASWGSYGEFSQTLYNAIDPAGDADILFVAAAGNGDALVAASISTSISRSIRPVSICRT